MAKSFDTIEKEYNEAKAQLDRFNINPNPDGSFTLDGKKITATTFAKLRQARKKIFDDNQKEYNKARRAGGRSSTGQRKESVPRLTTNVQLLQKENSDLAGLITAGKVKQGFNSVADMQAKIESNNVRISQINSELSSTQPQAATQSGGGTRLQGPVQGPFVGGAGEAGMQATAVGASPVSPVSPVNPASTGGGGGTRGGTDRTRRSKLPKNWEAKFREMFPEQSWLLDLDKTKYPQLNKLIQQGIINRSWETPESEARFNAELQNTDFYRELANTGKSRQIKSLVGDLGFDSVPFNKFLTTAMNFGWEGDALKSEVYKEAFRKDDNGNFANPTAVTRAKASTDYKKAQGFGRAFFSTVSDSTIEQRLTGVITDEDLIRQQRELAKTRYAHLGNLIDQGLTLEDIAGSFQQKAAQVLERDINSIDMGSADFETAFNFGEEGKKRMMSSGEWEIMLRSDKKYGWDKTENAKQEARGLAASIAQAFGKVI
jgi:hypothetical protein